MEQPASPSPAGNVAPPFVSVAEGPFAAPVLRRIVGMFGARAELPVDRLDEALVVVDALADHAGRLAADGRIAMALECSSGTLVMELGPLRAGSASQLIEAGAIPGVGNVIERLADELSVNSVNGGEVLRLRLSARS